MRLVPALMTVGLVLSVAQAPGGVITDGDFTDWSFGSVDTATVTREASGGNPGARLNNTTVSGPFSSGLAIKNDFSTADSLAGASFTLSLDVLSGPGAFGAGQTISLLAEQGGTIYELVLDETGIHANFDTLTFNGTFDEAAFSLLIGSGSATPEFDGGVATRFGFAGANSHSGTFTQYYDNFRLDSAAITVTSPPDPSAVPEPGSLTLLACGGLGLVAGRLRKRRNAAS